MGDENGQDDGKVLGEGAGVHVGSVDAEQTIDFGSFALSLAHSALVDLGVVEHPDLGKADRDLDSAKQTIAILEMLQTKTHGNLDPEEEKLLGSLLYELRMAFVEASSKKVEPGS